MSAAAQTAAGPVPPPDDEIRTGARTGRQAIRRILIVDDSRLQLRLLEKSLEPLGLTLISATSGEQALALCQNDPPDLVLSDWIMPGMSGIDLCQALRTAETGHYIYFILLTSKSQIDEVVKGLDLGADDFVSKPVETDELHARINAADRILRIERELARKNRMISETLEEVRALHADLERDLAEARNLQMALVQRQPLIFPAAEVNFLFQPTGHVGGDLVGSVALETPDRIGLFGIDVSGHGVASALITARLSAWLSGAQPEQNLALDRVEGRVVGRDPADVCRVLNDTFLREISTEHYFTMVYAVVDLAAGRLRIAQAGHPHPLILRAGGEVEKLGEGGLPIGLIPDADYEAFDVALAPGDRLMMHSDGLTESRRPDGRLLGRQGLSHLFRRHGALPGRRLLQALHWELSALNDDEFEDDLSCVLLDYRGPG
ncbi:fused response regulator/phosphatase [Rhodobacteraceae bacterium CCMM004]|nr:fused response regulator/phosphatase [Rhodobacteraceae bacterium CCMM004]